MEVSSPACPAATHSTNDGPLIMSATTPADYLQRPARVPSNVARVAVIAAWRAFSSRPARARHALKIEPTAGHELAETECRSITDPRRVNRRSYWRVGMVSMRLSGGGLRQGRYQSSS
jgi:hypothetical protein